MAFCTEAGIEQPSMSVAAAVRGILKIVMIAADYLPWALS